MCVFICLNVYTYFLLYSLYSSGMAKFAKVWSARNHPLYRELEASETISRLRMPREMKQFVEKERSMNLSGMPGTGEGVDFRLEEINTNIQRWLPRIPTPKDWEATCLNFDRLVALRDKGFVDMDVHDPKIRHSKNPQNIDKEVTEFRVKLRAEKYLSNVENETCVKALDGVLLDENLQNFCKETRSKRARFIDAYLDNEITAPVAKATSVTFKESPVYITVEERDKFEVLENQTLDVIMELIVNKLEAIEDQDMKDKYEIISLSDFPGKRNIRKTNYLNFYHEIAEYVTNQSDYSDDIQVLSLDTDER